MTAHDPGGRVRRPLPRGMQSAAVYGGERKEYRYRLARRWGSGPACCVVMMNPSTATESVDDPTVAGMVKRAQRWGFGTLMVGNVFAWRATDPTHLERVAGPVGPENDAHLIAMAADASGPVIMAYGTPRLLRLRTRGPAVARILEAAGYPLAVLELSAAGVPRHPLYLPHHITPRPWRAPAEGEA